MFLAAALWGAFAVGAEIEPATEGIAVVELFTSEGCSSCPPAEALLNELDKRAHDEELPIFGLAFHVDYWNYLGWEDRFSKSEFTRRQRRYAASIEEGRVYTPQMVVNGRDVFVGSNRSRAGQVIRIALKTPAEVMLALGAGYLDIQSDSNQRIVRASAAGKIPTDCDIVFALVEHGLESEVKRGENQGRRLVHRAVVRSLLVAESASPAKVHLQVPTDAKPENLEVIAFVQHRTSLNIVGAARAQILSK